MTNGSFVGNGAGLTNLAAPSATNSDALGNQSAALWAAATNALNLFQGAQIISNAMFSAEIGTNTAEGVAQALTNAMLSAQIGTNTATGVAQALTNTMLSAHISTNTAEGVAQGISNAMFTAHISTNKTVSEAAVPKAGGIMTGPVTNEVGWYGNGAGLTNLSVSETNAINTSIDTLNLATNANNSAITNNFYVQSLTNASLESRIGSGAGSGFPLTNDVDLAGYSMTNGSFVGDGLGITNVPGADTNYIAFFGESNVEVRVSSTNIYFGAPQIANNIANIQSVGAVASNRVMRAGDIMTGPLTNEFGYYGDGGGLTNLAAPTATNSDALGNQSAAIWAAATNALDIRVGDLETNSYQAFTYTLTPDAGGTCTVTYGHGSLVEIYMPATNITLSFDASTYVSTSGVNRVGVEIYTLTNSVSLDYSTCTNDNDATKSTTGWTTWFFRRVGESTFKGRQ